MGDPKTPHVPPPTRTHLSSKIRGPPSTRCVFSEKPEARRSEHRRALPFSPCPRAVEAALRGFSSSGSPRRGPPQGTPPKLPSPRCCVGRGAEKGNCFMQSAFFLLQPGTIPWGWLGHRHREVNAGFRDSSGVITTVPNHSVNKLTSLISQLIRRRLRPLESGGLDEKTREETVSWEKKGRERQTKAASTYS